MVPVEILLLTLIAKSFSFSIFVQCFWLRMFCHYSVSRDLTPCTDVHRLTVILILVSRVANQAGYSISLRVHFTAAFIAQWVHNRTIAFIYGRS